MMCQRFVIHSDRLPFRKAIEWTVQYYLKRLMSQYIDGSISCFVPILVAIEKKKTDVIELRNLCNIAIRMWLCSSSFVFIVFYLFILTTHLSLALPISSYIRKLYICK